MTHHAIIAGTGRAGTTFLVQLLTALGLDTGFQDSDKATKKYYASSNAGLEINMLKAESCPYIVKDPRFSEYVGEVLESGRFTIDHVYIPVRALDDAAMSRVRVSAGKTGRTPGGLWKTRRADRQRDVLLGVFYHLIQQLTQHDIPFTTMEFPRIVNDAGYLYGKLQGLLAGVTREQFDAVFQSVAQPKLVHTFSEKEKAALERASLVQRLKRWAAGRKKT